MAIERQSQQWPHRVAALHTAVRPSNYRDTEFYRHRPLVKDRDVVGGQAYPFPATTVNPPPNNHARPELDWEPTDPEQDTLPVDFPSEFSIGPGHRLPVDRQPEVLHRGLSLDLTHPGAASIRRMLHGEEHEEQHGNHGYDNWLPGMPLDEDITDYWNWGDHENPELGPAILDHLADRYEHSDLGTHWTTSADWAKSFAQDDNFGRDQLPLPVWLTAEWTGAGEDPYRRDTQGDWPQEREITMLPGAPLRITDVKIHHPGLGRWFSVLPEAQQREAALKMAYPGPKGYPFQPGKGHDFDYLDRLDPILNEFGERRRFSPTTINPPSDDEARPEITWQPVKPPQDPLPLNLPTGVHYRGHPDNYDDPDDEESDTYSVPVDRAPQELWRGVLVDLAHPNLGPVRRRLYGPEHEEEHGNPEYRNYLPDMPWDEEIADSGTEPWADHDLAHLLLDHISQGFRSPYTHGMSLGRHWSTDQSIGYQFAGGEMNNHDHQLPLGVLLGADWYGQGEDPYRRQTGGSFPEEHEITMLGGAPLHMQQVSLQHPETGEWIDLPLRPHQREAARTAGWHDDDWEDEDYHEGTPLEVHPFSYNTPMFPDSMSRPLYRDPTLGRDVYHFSPHEINPASDGPARPSPEWKKRGEPDHPTLDLNLPPSTGDFDADGKLRAWDRMNLPGDREPVKLYRGLALRLDDPELQPLRRRLYPGSSVNKEDDLAYQHGPKGARDRQPYLDPDMTNSALRSQVRKPGGEEYSDDEVDYDGLHRMILDHVSRRGLGTHWSTDKDQARNFARQGHMGNVLPVVITHDWYGHGEDPYRRGTDGEWTDEREITKLPSAPINVSEVEIHHGSLPPWKNWRTIYHAENSGEEPLRYHAHRTAMPIRQFRSHKR